MGFRACSSAIRTICNQRHLLLSIWINDLEEASSRAPIGLSSLCQPIGVFPQIWWSRGVLSSRTNSGNVLLSSLKLNRIPQKHIQTLVYICGRANLSRNSLFEDDKKQSLRRWQYHVDVWLMQYFQGKKNIAQQISYVIAYVPTSLDVLVLIQ